MKQQNVSHTNKVPATIYNAWKRLQSRGDVAQLTSLTGLSKPTIIQALKHRKANQELILEISKYFSKKEQKAVELEKKVLKILKQAS
jgi:mannose/fructose-specific phosphotransferase system component IIA